MQFLAASLLSLHEIKDADASIHRSDIISHATDMQKMQDFVPSSTLIFSLKARRKKIFLCYVFIVFLLCEKM